MDIHKPKPWHGWRAFLKEYGIIVLGVLTALAFEQIVQAVHWRIEVGEFTHGADQELADTLAAFKYRADQAGCVDQRLAELAAFQKAAQAGRPTMIRATIGEPSIYGMRNGVWQSRSPEVFNQMSAEKRLAYASLYSIAQRMSDQENAEGKAWQCLNAYVGFSTLSSEQLMHLNELLFEAKYLSNLISANYVTLRDQAKLQSIEPAFGARKKVIQPPDPALCKPLFRPAD